MARIILAFGLLGGLLLFGGSTVSATTPTPDTTIDVGDEWFCDSSFENGVCETVIKPGDTVQWNFVGSLIHTTTECGDDCDSPTGTPLWDSGLQSQGSTFKFTFNDVGRYLYFCTQHPLTMRGIINVGGVGGVAEIAQPDDPAAETTEESSGLEYDLIGAAAATVLAATLGLVGTAWHFARRRNQ